MSPYPKFVWSPTGGWYCNPPNWKRNTSLAMMFVLASSGVVWYLTAPLECLYGPGGDETEVVSNSASTLLPGTKKPCVCLYIHTQCVTMYLSSTCVLYVCLQLRSGLVCFTQCRISGHESMKE